jgi:ankyrin repeat protein
MIGASFSDDLPDDVWEYASRVSFKQFVRTLASQPRERMDAVLTQLFDPLNADKLEDTWKTFETRVKDDMALLASEHGYRDLFELLVDEHGVDVTEQHLLYAAMHNHPAMVRLILPQIPNIIGKGALSAATRRGFTQVARILLTDARVILGDAVVWAARSHNAPLTKMLADDPRTSREDVAQALRTTLTARDGGATVARVLLEQDAIPREELTKRLLITPNPGVRRVLQEYLTSSTPRPVDAALMSISSGDLGKLFQGYSYDQNVFWRMVATREMTLGDIIYDLADTRDATPEWYRGRDHVLSWLLDMRNRGRIAEYFKISMKTLGEKLVEHSARHGYADLLRVLIQEHELDPSSERNYAIREAAFRGRTNVVLVLLADARVDPSADKNFAIGVAAKEGYLETARALLADPRVDPSDLSNRAIRIASMNGRTEVVRLLLADPRVDPSDRNNQAIREAARHGHADVVQMLLTDPRVDPSMALIIASDEGHIHVVRSLLADPRTDPSKNNNEAIRFAVWGGHMEISQMLIADPRVDPSTTNNYAIRRAVIGGYASTARLLLAHPRVRQTLTKDNVNYLLSIATKPEIRSILEDYLREIQRGGPVDDDSEPPTKMIKEPLFFI